MIPPAHHARQDPDFEERDELLLLVDLAAGRACGLHSPRCAEHAIAIQGEQAGEQAWPRCFGCGLQREHLDMSLPDLNVVAMPCDGTLHDLTVHARIAAKLPSASPLLKIEQVTEELEDIGLDDQL